jgi:hypothetical protein
MLVRMLVGGIYGAAGSEVDVPGDEAVRLFSARFAVPAAPPLERAVQTVQETRGPAENSSGGRSGGTKRKKRK